MMRTGVMRVFDLLLPPSHVLDPPSAGDWRRCDEIFGSLPADYKLLIERYGSGTINDFMWILNPSSRNEFLNIFEVSRRNLGALRETQEKFPLMYQMKIFPEPGGLLPCAVTDNGDTVYWETIGDPDRWPVAVMGPRAPDTFRFDGSLSEFLGSVLSGSLVCDRFPDFPGDEAPAFRPAAF